MASVYNQVMSTRISQGARVAGGIVPIGVACLLVLVRTTLDPADLVLILVLVVVGVAAAGDRIAAAIAAASAAASFDFFLTRPYGSLRVESARDIETTLILLVIGLAVGQVAIVGRDRRAEARRAQEELTRLELVAERIAAEPTVLPLVELVEREIAEMMSLATCRFGLARPNLPELCADGSVAMSTRTLAGRDFALPAEGVALAVVGGGETVGWLRLIPASAVGIALESRKVAVALSQQLGAALARPGTELARG